MYEAVVRPDNARLANRATPSTAATLSVPDSEPVVTPSIVTVSTDATIVAVDAVTVLPPVSCTVTTGCVVNAAPDDEPSAAVVSASRAGAPTDTAMLWVAVAIVPTRVFAPSNTEYVTVYACPAVPVTPRLPNVATPLVNDAVVVPTSEPVATPSIVTVPIDARTVPTWLTVLPPVSCTVSIG